LGARADQVAQSKVGAVAQIGIGCNTHELTENLRKNITVDWSQRESVRASLRLMVRRILRKYKYPPDLADGAVELVLLQAETLGDSWAEA
jgi:hypothetical protein